MAQRGSTAAKSAAKSTSPAPLIEKQPQSKREMAVSGGMFLHTDDRWSLAYFDKKDLHSTERELLG